MENTIYINKEEYDALILALTNKLLTFFDQVDYPKEEYKDIWLSFICRMGEYSGNPLDSREWLYTHTFSASEWLEFYRDDQVDQEFEQLLKNFHYQLNKANAKLYAIRYPQSIESGQDQ